MKNFVAKIRAWMNGTCANLQKKLKTLSFRDNIIIAIMLCLLLTALCINGNIEQLMDEAKTAQDANRAWQESQVKIFQRVKIYADTENGGTRNETHSFTKEEWLQYIMELPADIRITDIDLSLFDFVPVADPVGEKLLPEEMYGYACGISNSSVEFDGAPYYWQGINVQLNNEPMERLRYMQRPYYDGDDNLYLCLVTDEEKNLVIEGKIEEVKNPKLLEGEEVVCDDEGKLLGWDFIVFSRDGKLYAISSWLVVYEIVPKA